MHHLGYWVTPEHGIMDVAHHDDVTDYHLPEGERTTVCSSTVTYQLDGHVGLVAELALMAQAAALAREVRTGVFHGGYASIICVFSSAIGRSSLMTATGTAESTSRHGDRFTGFDQHHIKMDRPLPGHPRSPTWSGTRLQSAPLLTVRVQTRSHAPEG